MRSDKANAAGQWVRWVGAVLIGALGVVVLFGGLGLGAHPMHQTLGWALLGYSVLRILINIWLSRKKPRSKIEIM